MPGRGGRRRGKEKEPEEVYSRQEAETRHSLPAQLPRRNTDIYLLTGLVLEQRARAERLLRAGLTVWLHALGSNTARAAATAAWLGEQLRDSGCRLEVRGYTETWERRTEDWRPSQAGPRYTNGLHLQCRPLPRNTEK